jgi:threonine dehydratase
MHPDATMSLMPSVTRTDVEAAARTIAGAVARTPSHVSETLSEILGSHVVLKFENMQFTASFKERGARNKLGSLTSEQRAAGVVAVSAGNHAQAVARHAKLLGVPATIVMPASTPFVKVARTRYLGATVELHDGDLDECFTRCRELTSTGATLVHPYDDPLVIAGQGTVALELLEDHPEIDVIVVPVGGGGLIAGVVTAAADRVEVVGVQSESYPAFVSALDGVDRPMVGPTMAEGIAVKRPGALATSIVRDAGCDVVIVSESQIESAVNLLLEIEKVVVEGAGAAPVAALAEFRELFAGRTVGVVLSGGNIDPRLLAAVINRGLVRSGRLARVRADIDDRPGTLAALLAVVAEAGANLLDVQHQREFAAVPIREAEVELVIECQDAAHRDAVITALEGTGYRVRLLPLD